MDGTSQDYKLVCSHRFHTECIIDSLRHNPECPICRDTAGVEVKHWSDYDYYEIQHNNSPSHINSCVTCGKNNPNSELYYMYKLISDFGNEMLSDKYTELKSLNNEFRKTLLDLEKELSTSLDEIMMRYKNDRIGVYHKIGKSEKYSKYMKISKKTKILNGNFKRELSIFLQKLGYENDDNVLTNLVNEYCKSFAGNKSNKNWCFQSDLKCCSKYSLDKYKSVVVNTTNNSLEI
jgi:hypothetical protein